MSNLTRWDPFRDMWSMRSAMDWFFENALTNFGSDWNPASWDLALDVAETDDEYLVKASIPGIEPDDVEITYDANILTIKGETKKDENIEDERYHLRERRYGSFSRSISLPGAIKPDQIEAIYDTGVLTLHLPKRDEVKPKRIKVQHERSKMIEGKASAKS
jgi:HSP20 family protein